MQDPIKPWMNDFIFHAQNTEEVLRNWANSYPSAQNKTRKYLQKVEVLPNKDTMVWKDHRRKGIQDGSKKHSSRKTMNFLGTADASS